MAPQSSSSITQCFKKPGDPKLIWKYVIYTNFRAEIFTVAAKLRVLAHTSTEMRTKDVNKVLSNK